MIHVSSDYVFDGSKREPYLESDATGPLSQYGRSKLAGEQAVAEAAPNGHTIVRSSWLFGSRGPCFPATILRLAAERDELSVVDDQVGCPTFTGHLAQAPRWHSGRGPPQSGLSTSRAQARARGISWHARSCRPPGLPASCAQGAPRTSRGRLRGPPTACSEPSAARRCRGCRTGAREWPSTCRRR